MTLRIGIEINYTEVQNREDNVRLAREAEDLGYDAIWCSEVYTYDAFTTLTHLACNTSTLKVGTNIAQLYARTPSLLATTSASLDQISGGRFILGIGASGPQVIEGWHGVAYDRPVTRTREIIEICRLIWSGERLNYAGQVYDLTKHPKMKILNSGHRSDIPIFVASLGPKNVEMSAELADGWLPYPYSTARGPEVFGPSLEAGLAKRSPDLPPLRLAPFTFVGDEQHGYDAARMVLALYIGGMGSREQNFYNRLAQRYGFVEEARLIQDLYLGGDKAAAMAAVPETLIDEVSIIGDEARMKDRLQAFEAAGATDLVVAFMAPDAGSRSQMMTALARANG